MKLNKQTIKDAVRTLWYEFRNYDQHWNYTKRQIVLKEKALIAREDSFGKKVLQEDLSFLRRSERSERRYRNVYMASISSLILVYRAKYGRADKNVVAWDCEEIVSLEYNKVMEKRDREFVKNLKLKRKKAQHDAKDKKIL